MVQTRQSKYAALEKLVKEKNTYLADHHRASVAVAQRKVETKWEKLRLPQVDVKVSDTQGDKVNTLGRTLLLSKQQKACDESAKLDGCYCLKTDLLKETASKEVIHDGYKDLPQVEWAFRTSKTVHLEARPVYVHLAIWTRGHLFVLMLGYLLVQELSRCRRSLDITVEEGLDELKTLCTTQVIVKGK